MRYVLDTSVLVAAVRSNPGASNKLIEDALLQRFSLLATANLFFEYEAVLTWQEQLVASGLSADQMSDLLNALAAIVEEVPSFLSLEGATPRS